MKEALFWKMCPAVSEPLVPVPWCLSSFGSGLKLDRYNPWISWVMLRNAAGASLGCRENLWWLNRRWGVLWIWIRSWVLFVWWVPGDLSEGFVTLSTPHLLKAPFGIPEIMKLTLKPCFVQESTIFFLAFCYFNLSWCTWNLSFKRLLFPQVFDQYSEMLNRSKQTV